MRHWWSLAILLTAMFCVTVPSFGALEVGLGVMAPGGAGAILGPMVLVPRATLELGILGVGADLWFSPSSDTYMLLPFLQFQVHLGLFKLYSGVAPVFLGGPTGLTLLPPGLGFAAKGGFGVPVLGMVGLYGELLLGVSPLLVTITSTSFVAGVGFSF